MKKVPSRLENTIVLFDHSFRLCKIRASITALTFLKCLSFEVEGNLKIDPYHQIWNRKNWYWQISDMFSNNSNNLSDFK